MLSVDTGIGFSFSKKYFAKIHPRYGLSSRSIETGVGILDSNYRGNVKVVLHNLPNKQVKFDVVDRILQVVFERVQSFILEEVSEFKDTTERNERGFDLTEGLSKNFSNNCIPEYVPDNLKWYERDGLMKYINKLKYDDFISNTDEHFKNKFRCYL